MPHRESQKQQLLTALAQQARTSASPKPGKPPGKRKPRPPAAQAEPPKAAQPAAVVMHFSNTVFHAAGPIVHVYPAMKEGAPE